ncbi:hypothetical protein SprV_0602226000 [Sparganum proliferum]
MDLRAGIVEKGLRLDHRWRPQGAGEFAANTRTASTTTTPPFVTLSPRRTSCTKSTSTVPPTTTELLSTVVAALYTMDYAGPAREAEEIQSTTVYELPTKGTAAPFGVDGSSLLIDKTQFLQRWAEHFRGVLSHPSTISDAANDHLPQGETNEDLDLSPSLQETIKAVQRLSSRKTSGSDTITAETHKHGCPKLMNHPIALFGRCGVKENSRMI